jgi:hypothetical protein
LGKSVRAKQQISQPLYHGLQLMPALHRFPDEAARIGRIVAAFGELEFILASSLGEVLGDRDTALRAIFRLASGRARIDILDALLRPGYEKIGRKSEYVAMLLAVRHCQRIRNQYAHCHYGDQKLAGLFLTNLQDAAEKSDSFDYLWRHVDVPLLDQQEHYFLYTQQCLQFLHDEYRVKSGRTGVPHGFPWPTKREQPPLHNPPSQHVPPWLSATQKQRHIELALERERSDGLRARPSKAPKTAKPSSRQRREEAMKRKEKR